MEMDLLMRKKKLGDGINDGSEVNIHNTDPLVVDSDGDGASDGLEVIFGTNPDDINESPAAGSTTVGISDAGAIGPYLDNVLPSLTPSPSTSENWQVEDAFEASGLEFEDLKGVVVEPNSTYINVIERQGTLQRVDVSDLSSTTLTKQQTLNISSLTVNGDNGGLRSVVFHPEYNLEGSPNKDYIYCFYTTTANTSRGFSNGDGGFFYRLSRFTRNSAGNFPLNSELVLIQQHSLDEGQHFGGGLVFDKDGFLIISWGDMEFNSGRVGVPFYQDAQRIDRIFQAAILRIDVDNQGGTISQAPTRTLQGDTGPNAVVGTSQSCLPSHNYYHVDNFSGVNYMIPSDNYFLNNAPSPGTAFTDTPLHGAALDEHQALGVRNPWRMAVDAVDGDIAMFNVGSNSGDDFEEVEILSPGANYGWPYLEGTTSQTGETGRSEPPAQYGPTYLGTETNPAAFWDHNSGRVSVGGAFYRGNRWPQILDNLIFADHSTGRIWALDYKSAGAAATARSTSDGVSVPSNYSVRLLVDTSLSIRQMTSGPINGREIFIAANGRIHRLFNSADSNPEPPATLSATGAFTDLATMTPREGLLPYAPASELWSDRASKQRWIAVPNNSGVPGEYDTPDEKIAYSEDGEWQFPVGTVFVKNFQIPTDLTDQDNSNLLQPVETRFLVRGEDGVYFYFTYQWRADGSDADLLASGTTTDYQIIDESGAPAIQTWTYPSRADCIDCHQTGAGSVLGMKSRQMNHPILYPSLNVTANQITTFSSLGLFDTPPDFSDLPGALKSVAITDESESLELRVRSYLDSNCSYCHRPESSADRAEFDARLTTPLALSGIIGEAPLAGELGVAGAEIVMPGSPSSSVLYIRDSSTDEANRMPPIGRSLNDPDYLPVLQAWIERLGFSEFDQWAIANNISGSLLDDHDGDGVANVIEFFLGLNAPNNDRFNLPNIDNFGLANPEISIPISGAALSDGFSIVVEGSLDLENWHPAGDPDSGLVIVNDTSAPGVSGDLQIRFVGPDKGFIRYGISIPEQ